MMGHKCLGLLCLSVLWTLQTVHSRGAASLINSDANNEYEIIPHDRVTANSPYASSQPDQSVEGIYDSVSLGYFSSYYAQYRSFIGTAEHQAMQEQIQGDTLVCVNYAEVRNGSHLGLFTCPLPFELSDFTSCCGENYAEFCCYPGYGEDTSIVTNAIFLCTCGSIVILAGLGYLILGKRL